MTSNIHYGIIYDFSFISLILLLPIPLDISTPLYLDKGTFLGYCNFILFLFFCIRFLEVGKVKLVIQASYPRLNLFETTKN
jgi:hypothetical protein